MNKEITIPDEAIRSKIYWIRDQKVMLDRDLAALYEVTYREPEQSCKKEYQTLPGRLYVPAHQRGI